MTQLHSAGKINRRIRKLAAKAICILSFNFPFSVSKIALKRVNASELEVVKKEKKKFEPKTNRSKRLNFCPMDDELHLHQIKVQGPIKIDIEGNLILAPKGVGAEDKKESLFEKISKVIDLTYKLVNILPTAEAFVIRRLPTKKQAVLENRLNVYGEKVELQTFIQPERFHNISQDDASKLSHKDTERYSCSELAFQYDKSGLQELPIRVAETNTSQPDLLTVSRFKKQRTPKNPYFAPNLKRHDIAWDVKNGVIIEIKKLNANSGCKLPIAVTKNNVAFIGAYSSNHVAENKPLKGLFQDYVTDDHINRALNGYFDQGKSCNGGLTPETRNAIRRENIEALWKKQKKLNKKTDQILIAVLVTDDEKVYNRAIYRRGASYVYIEGKGLFHVVADTEFFNSDLLNIKSEIILVIKEDLWGRPTLFIECSPKPGSFLKLPKSHVSLTDRKHPLYLGKERWDNTIKVLKKYKDIVAGDRRNSNWDDPLKCD